MYGDPELLTFKQMLAACAVLGGFQEAYRVGILDYIMSQDYQKVWQDYADTEWLETFWELWTQKSKNGMTSCASAIPDSVQKMAIWNLEA